MVSQKQVWLNLPHSPLPHACKNCTNVIEINIFNTVSFQVKATVLFLTRHWFTLGVGQYAFTMGAATVSTPALLGLGVIAAVTVGCYYGYKTGHESKSSFFYFCVRVIMAKIGVGLSLSMALPSLKQYCFCCYRRKG